MFLNLSLNPNVYLNVFKLNLCDEYFWVQAEPSTVAAQQPQQEAKVGQANFSCDVCSVFVNSADALKSHTEGKNHAKKVNSQKQEEFRSVCNLLSHKELITGGAFDKLGYIE